MLKWVVFRADVSFFWCQSPSKHENQVQGISPKCCPLSRNWRAAVRAGIKCKGPATETLRRVSTQEPEKNALFGTQRTNFFPFANTICWFYMPSMIQRCLMTPAGQSSFASSACYLNFLQKHLKLGSLGFYNKCKHICLWLMIKEENRKVKNQTKNPNLKPGLTELEWRTLSFTHPIDPSVPYTKHFLILQ